jgi:hypothetical protein
MERRNGRLLAGEKPGKAVDTLVTLGRPANSSQEGTQQVKYVLTVSPELMFVTYVHMQRNQHASHMAGRCPMCAHVHI